MWRLKFVSCPSKFHSPSLIEHVEVKEYETAFDATTDRDHYWHEFGIDFVVEFNVPITARGLKVRAEQQAC